MASSEDILEIVGCEHYMAWSNLPDVMVYKKDGKPFGLMSVAIMEGVIMINSIAKNDEKFTFEMQRELVRVIRKNPIVYLMSTCSNSTAINKLMDTYHEDGINSFFTKGI